jgi:hypothetical protein
MKNDVLPVVESRWSWVGCIGFAPSAAQKQKGMVGTDYI